MWELGGRSRERAKSQKSKVLEKPTPPLAQYLQNLS